MAAKFNIDKLDLRIIQEMLENAETPYAELGKKLFVSGGTMPAVVIIKYNDAINQISQEACVPASKKYASISIHGERNIARTKAKIIFFFDCFPLMLSLRWKCR